MLEAWELFVGMLQELFDSLLIQDFGAMNLDFEHESFGIYEQMTLPTIDLLSTIVTAFLSAYPASLDRLTVYYSSAGLRISLQANS